LKEYRAEEGGKPVGEEDDSQDEHSSGEVEEPQLMRARSVEYKGHIRHLSAGSAKLLDIRRSSVQSTDTPPRSPVPARAAPASAREVEGAGKPG
jgi:hypothetical protein